MPGKRLIGGSPSALREHPSEDRISAKAARSLPTRRDTAKPPRQRAVSWLTMPPDR